jgi:15-cis-phytoene synthase
MTMTARELWQKLAVRSQSNLYFALVFLPADRREAFRDVYRFLRAADDVADGALPVEEKRRQLAAWHRALDAVYAGTADDETGRRLAQAVRDFGLDRALFERILGALDEDVVPRRFPDWPALERWCDAVSGSLGLLCLQILGADTPTARAYARELGIALQLANILRDVAEDAALGRVYLPLDELEGSVDELLAGRLPRATAQRQADRVRQKVAAARAHLTPGDEVRLVVPEIWADVYLALVDELERIDFDVFRRRAYLRRRTKLALAARRWLRGRAASVFRAAR